MFSSYKESAEKLLADHLLKGDSRLEDCVDSPQTGLQAWVHVRVGMFGPFRALIRLGLLSRDTEPKSMVPTTRTRRRRLNHEKTNKNLNLCGTITLLIKKKMERGR